jgi:hypothetical protein
VMDLERDQRKLRHERLLVRRSKVPCLLGAAPRKYRVADDDSY